MAYVAQAERGPGAVTSCQRCGTEVLLGRAGPVAAHCDICRTLVKRQKDQEKRNPETTTCLDCRALVRVARKSGLCTPCRSKRHRRGEPRTIVSAFCSGCGEFFIALKGNRKYCSRTCATRANYDPLRRRVKKLARYNGFTQSDYDSIAARQGGRCLICQTKPTTLNVDHDHATGAVRGLLCLHCNTALGQLKDNSALLRAAADYLDRHAGRLEDLNVDD